MALALDGAGRQNEALAAYGRAREVLAAIEGSNPTLLAVTRDRAWIDTTTADVLIREARDAEALPLLEAARKARETLVKIDRTVVRDQTQLIRIHSWIAGIHAGSPGVRGTGIVQAGGGGRIGGGRRSPWRLELPVAARQRPLRLRRILLSDGQAFGGLGVVGQGAAIGRKLVEAEPSQEDHRIDLADGLRRSGIVLQKCVRPAEAVSAFREALAILEGLAHPTPANGYDIVCNQSLLSGVAPDAGSGLTAADGRAQAAKAMESLRRAIAAGWNRPAQLIPDPDLDPVRSRLDFQLLLLDLAFPNDPFARPD